MFKAFGADPDGAVVRRLGEPLDPTEAIPGPAIRVGRAGKWVVAIEDGEPPQGVRPDGRPPGQLLAGELQRQRTWDSKGWQEPLAWRAQAIADFSGVQVPPAELRAAEEAWLAIPEPVRGRVALIDAAPVRAHVNALIASGMDDRRIAELSGRVTTGFIDLLLRGFCTEVSVESARSLLVIRDPSV